VLTSVAYCSTCVLERQIIVKKITRPEVMNPGALAAAAVLEQLLLNEGEIIGSLSASDIQAVVRGDDIVGAGSGECILLDQRI
jgi:hypothetical protein